MNDWLSTYTVNISLGTPPQTFRAIVDLNWADTFVSSSSSCGGEHCGAFSATYNSSASSTYTENGTLATISYTTLDGLGYLSSDDFTVGNRKVPNIDFVELCACNLGNHVPIDLAWYDTVFGFAMGTERPPVNRKQQQSKVSSPFRQMTEQKILDRNMFSILWPTSHESTGDLMLGGFNEHLFEGDPVSHRLFPDDAEWRIQVTAVYLFANPRSNGLQESNIREIAIKSEPGNDMSAHFSTRIPFISVPGPIRYYMTHNIDMEVNMCAEAVVVNCDRLHELPELIIEFGNQNITMHGADYILRHVLSPEERAREGCEDTLEVCVHGIAEMPTDGEDGGLMTLGMGFMKKMYTVFDWDEKTVSCELIPCWLH